MKILVAYDGSISADAAIEDLRRAGLPLQAEALVVCVEDGGSSLPQNSAAGDLWTSRLAEAESLAETAAERIGSYFPQWTVSSEALWGSPAKVILDTSGAWHPDLIVVGSHGRSRVARLFMGSVSLEVLHKAACSVRVVRAGGSSDGPIRIVIANDGSPGAQAVIRAVASRSWPEKTEARIVSVVQTLVPTTVDALEANTYAREPAFSVIRQVDETERTRLRDVAEKSASILGRTGLIARPLVTDGDPREVILGEAELLNADAIFVGARGLSRIERLVLGSVSTYVVTHVHCTVEVVRQVV